MTRDFFRVRPLALICAAFIASAALCARAPDLVRLIVGAAAAAAAVFSLIVRRRSGRGGAFAAAMFAAALASVISFAYFGLWRGSVRSYIGSDHEITATVSGVESATSFGGSYTVTVGGIDGRKRSFPALLSLEFGGDLAPGDHVEFTGTAYAPENSSPYFDYVGYNSARGIEIGFSVSDPAGLKIAGFGFRGARGLIHRVRSAVNRVFYRYLEDEPRGLVSALFLGDRSSLPQALRRDFTRAGLPNLLAVSGMHLAVIVSLVSAVLESFRCPAIPRRIVVCLCAVFYVFLAGLPLSAVRAAIMLIISQIGEAAMRKSDPPTSLFVSVAAIIAFSPPAALDIGLALSFSAALGIVTLGRAINARIEIRTGRRASGVLSSLAASLSASLFTLPVIWLAFGRMSLVSPLTSLVFSWPVMFVVGLTAILVALSPLPPLAAAAALPLRGLCWAVCDGVTAVGGIRGIMVSLGYPFAWIVFCAAGAVIAVLVAARRDTLVRVGAVMAAAAAVFAVCAGIYERGETGVVSVVYQPVKKNDVICVKASGTTVVADISDGSRTTRSVYDGIVREYFRRFDIDVYMLTHWHSKTPSAVASLLERCCVGKLLLPLPYDETSESADEKVRRLAGEAGAEIVYYPADADAAVDIGDLRIDAAALGHVGRSAHPTVALRFSGAGGSVVYAGASAYDSAQYRTLDSWLGGCGALILGAHGPKASYPPLIGGDMPDSGCLIVWSGHEWAADLAAEEAGRAILASDDRPVTARISPK
ncbi:MAG: ComEC/Rec2 family competence protein [Clostridiales bacterium]|nr:ComEC/Rec2 family competence protein [Clostridiales bacterium]